MRIRLCLLAIAALVFLWWQRHVLGAVISLILLSAVIAYLLSPLNRLIEKKLSGRWGPPLSFLALALVVTGFFFSFLPSLIRQGGQLAEQLPAIWEQAGSWLAGLEEHAREMGLPPQAVDQAAERISKLAEGFIGILGDGLTGFAQSLMGAGWILLSPIVAYYMLKDRKALFNQMERWIPSRARPFALSVAGGVREALGRFVRGQMLVSAMTGALTAFGLFAVGMPSWLLFGMLMAVFDLIPYVGPVIGAVPILIVAASQGLPLFLKALAVTLVAQQIESLFIQPRIMAGSANLHPALIIVGLFAGGVAAGLPGMIFALPVALTLRVVTLKCLELKLYGKSA